ncbi:MAG TPA: 4'-phosphopantetheinyl transferase superfamily protein [Solirubrobacterales bacterium]|jgi:phosphopantetheinyl transferase|nr:4'-phosphopantetheinyl transferase superfamily protein [Solirubrobacterales bacterium]
MNRDGIAEPRSSGDAPAAPAPGEIHVWRIVVGDTEGRARARAALGAILAGYLGGAEPRLRSDGNGKPGLATDPGRLSFNLSHSGGLALVAIAPGDVELGVDVERLRPRRDLARLAERWLPEADAATVAAPPESGREATFYAAWTRHEARVKCTGVGLAGPAPGPEVSAWPIEIDAGYAAAVALATSAEPRIVLRAWPCRR